MIQETKRKAPSYDIGDLVRVVVISGKDLLKGVEEKGVYQVVGSNEETLTIMTTKGEFAELRNWQVERWGE